MKRSIRKQMAVLFIGLMVLVMAATILVNKLFFEQFYTHRMRSTLETAYAQIDEHITAQGFDRDFFTGPFTQLCNSNNMNVVVVDESYNTVIGNSSLIAARIWGYVVAGDNDDAEILEKKNADENIQKRAELKEAFSELSDEEAEILVRYYKSDKGERQQIADELGITINNLYVKIKRIKDKLLGKTDK